MFLKKLLHFLESLYKCGLYYLNMNKTTSSLSETICLLAALVQLLLIWPMQVLLLFGQQGLGKGEEVIIPSLGLF